MKCRGCGGQVRFAGGGMGESDPPGCYFYTGVIAASTALVVFALAAWFWSWQLLVWTFVLLGAAVVLLGWCLVAMTEGYGNRCEQCGFEERVFPWSL